MRRRQESCLVHREECFPRKGDTQRQVATEPLRCDGGCLLDRGRARDTPHLIGLPSFELDVPPRPGIRLGAGSPCRRQSTTLGANRLLLVPARLSQ